MSGVLIIPRDKLDMVSDRPEDIALLVLLVRDARYGAAGQLPDGTPLRPGQLVTCRSRLAGLLRRTESSAYRGLQRLKNRALIELKANSGKTVVTLVDWRSYQSLPTRNRTESERESDANRTEIERGSNSERTHKKTITQKQNLLPHTPSTSSPTTFGDTADADWAEVEGALRSEKVSAVRATVESAQRRDLTPADAMRLVGEYRAKPWAWQPGALVRMLTGELAEWPPAAEAHQRQQRAAERIRLVEEQVVRRDRNAAERQSNRAQDAALRRRWAELPNDERVRLLDLRQPNWRQLRRPASSDAFAAVLAEPPPERTRTPSRRPQAVA